MGAIVEQLRGAIEASEKSRYRIARETGISESQLSRFMTGEKGLSPDAMEKVADCLNLEFILRPKRRKR
ncbi:MAG: hypothetical protein Fues2KO_50520 [Fuerstiella sp.]